MSHTGDARIAAMEAASYEVYGTPGRTRQRCDRCQGHDWLDTMRFLPDTAECICRDCQTTRRADAEATAHDEAWYSDFAWVLGEHPGLTRDELRASAIRSTYSLPVALELCQDHPQPFPTYERHPRGLEPGKAVCPLCFGIFDHRLHPHDLCPHCYQDHVGDLDYQPERWDDEGLDEYDPTAAEESAELLARREPCEATDGVIE